MTGIVGTAILMICLWSMFWGQVLGGSTNRVLLSIFLGVWALNASADLVNKIWARAMYKRYVGKTWLYHCGGHPDGTTCEHDGQTCMVFPVQREQTEFMHYMERNRNVTVFEATFASGEQGYVHINSLKKP